MTAFRSRRYRAPPAAPTVGHRGGHGSSGAVRRRSAGDRPPPTRPPDPVCTGEPSMTAYPILVDAERRLTALVESLEPAEFSRPTPCAGWDVRAVLSHTLAGIEIFASTMDGLPAPTAE